MTSAWTVGNDIITPTFKVNRNRIEDIYSANYKLQVLGGVRQKGGLENRVGTA